MQAGIKLADEAGLDAVSIRSLAGVLQTRPMSLYTYIASKDDLLALMADAVVAEVILPGALSADWRQALRAIARRSHETFVAHPWVLEIAGRRPDLGVNALAHAEQMLEAIAPLRLDASRAWAVLFVVNDYTLGHALRMAGARREPGIGFPAFDPEAFPRLASAAEAGAQGRGEETFEAGLEAVLAGVERTFLTQA